VAVVYNATFCIVNRQDTIQSVEFAGII